MGRPFCRELLHPFLLWFPQPSRCRHLLTEVLCYMSQHFTTSFLQNSKKQKSSTQIEPNNFYQSSKVISSLEFCSGADLRGSVHSGPLTNLPWAHLLQDSPCKRTWTTRWDLPGLFWICVCRGEWGLDEASGQLGGRALCPPGWPCSTWWPSELSNMGGLSAGRVQGCGSSQPPLGDMTNGLADKMWSAFHL